MRLETEREREARKQQTIDGTVRLMQELFTDTPWMSATKHRRIPRKVMVRVHDHIRAATATGGMTMEVRTWISELQVATGNQGESWVKDWPWKGNRIRHVQLLRRIFSEEGVRYEVLWTSPDIYIDPYDMPN